jgi:oligopeptide/dipeptide ABC transporter ATP-binding protein
MQQRVMIALALACNPRVVIADEPTTALDVTVQAQILALLKRIRDTYGASVLLITHNMGVIADIADRVAVMYAGRVVETASVGKIFSEPSHPYTFGLLKSIPSLIGDRHQELTSIPGGVPSLDDLAEGCAFHPRCPYSSGRCEKNEPPLKGIRVGHWAACWNPLSGG